MTGKAIQLHPHHGLQSTQRPRILLHLEVVCLRHQHQRLGCRPQHGVEALTSAIHSKAGYIGVPRRFRTINSVPSTLV